MGNICERRQINTKQDHYKNRLFHYGLHHYFYVRLTSAVVQNRFLSVIKARIKINNKLVILKRLMQSWPELPIDGINTWEVMHRNSLRMISIWPSLHGVRHQSGCRAFQVKFYRISCQRSIFLFFLFFPHIYLIRCWVTSRKPHDYHPNRKTNTALLYDRR